jgi:hypothetical protein
MLPMTTEAAGWRHKRLTAPPMVPWEPARRHRSHRGKPASAHQRAQDAERSGDARTSCRPTAVPGEHDSRVHCCAPKRPPSDGISNSA